MASNGHLAGGAPVTFFKDHLDILGVRLGVMQTVAFLLLLFSVLGERTMKEAIKLSK